MKYPTKLSDAVHILAFLALHPGANLTSERISESVQTNPAYIRQLMSALRKGGLLTSVKGHPRPALAREPAQITLLDAYRAVEGDKPILHQDTHTNPACGVGVNIQLVLADCYREVQESAEKNAGDHLSGDPSAVLPKVGTRPDITSKLRRRCHLRKSKKRLGWS